MTRIDANDLAFIIPLRIDSADRVRNLRIILRYLAHSFAGAEIILVENAPISPCQAIAANAQAKYIFMCKPGSFSKTRTINAALVATSGQIICVYDADMLTPPAAIRTPPAGAALMTGDRL